MGPDSVFHSLNAEKFMPKIIFSKPGMTSPVRNFKSTNALLSSERAREGGDAVGKKIS